MAGDNLLDRVHVLLDPSQGLTHLDAFNPDIKLAANTAKFIEDPKTTIVSAHAYLGARAIKRALEEGADIVICMFRASQVA